MQWLWDLTSQDDNLVLLWEVVKQGWPQIIQDLPTELKPFWTFCEVITIADGLLLKGDKIIVPERRQERKSSSKYIMVTWVSKSIFSEQKQLYIGLDFMMS